MQEEGYTILAPQMSPIHFEIVEALLRSVGYNVVLLPSVDHAAVDTGLKYVNNDICYPSILVTGQIMEAVLSGKYDLERTAVLISQTGGGCRATNYIALIRKALKDSGHENVPVISLSVAGGLDEDNPGFKLLQPGLIKRAVYALLYGDLIMKCLYRTRPYEAEAGSADRLYESFMSRAKTLIPRTNRKAFYELCEDTVKRFDALPLIEGEGCEADVPGLVDFFLFGTSNQLNMKDELGTKRTSRLTHAAGIKLIEGMRAPINKMLERSERFEPYGSIYELGEKAEKVLSLCNTMGEGWLLTAEMIDLIELGTPNIVCASPFACLPNHVVGKSVIKRLRQMHPESNIVAVDYDPGASEVNQLNRIKLMISVAKENFKNGAAFKIENPADPTTAAGVATSGSAHACGTGEPSITLSPAQLEQIEQAKHKAGVR